MKNKLRSLTSLLLGVALFFTVTAATKHFKPVNVAAYVQSGKKINGNVRLNAKGRTLIRELLSERRSGQRAMAVAESGVLSPEVDEVEIPNFPYPVVDDGGVVVHYTNITVTAARWVTTQHGLRWDFMYRPAGTVTPLKPPIVAENSQVGQAAVVLPATDEYEYLPLFR